MKHIWTLTLIRIRLALRSRTFIFFSLMMPLTFLFFFAAVFSKRNSEVIAYILGAVLALTVMGSFWGLSMQLVMFREQGILRRFRLAPVGAGAMLGSSILSNYFLVLPTVLVEFLVSRWVFGLHTWGNLWAVFALVSIGAATFSAFGLIVASVTNTMQETQVINNLVWSAFLFLSGATIPLVIFPGWIQHVALFLPATYLATGLEGAMLKVVGVREVAGDIIALAVGLVVAFEVSRQLFRWEPEAKVSGRAKLWVVVVMVPFLLFGLWENVYGARLTRLRQNFQAFSERGPQNPTK
ncbi:MAG: ABC transporter permease [Candidatus Acidiferrales bacterium]